MNDRTPALRKGQLAAVVVLGVSPKTVDAHLVQAMRHLRRALDAILNHGVPADEPPRKATRAREAG
jgi:hypothetical protein